MNKTIIGLLFFAASLTHSKTTLNTSNSESLSLLPLKQVRKSKMFSQIILRKIPLEELTSIELATTLYSSEVFNKCLNSTIELNTTLPLPKLPTLGKGYNMDLIRFVGDQIWKIIEKSKPVLSLDSKNANAYPPGIDCWLDLEKWQLPIAQYYEASYINKFNIEVVKFRFRVTFVPGGQHKGKGLYLTNVRLEPSEVVLKPFYNLDSEVEVLNAFNIGTNQQPIAAILLNLKWTINTMFQASHSNFQILVTGDGQLKAY